ncbi:serine protease [Seongchinamella unica]|uniref:Serine protease n=1 Tax=Seongchinamella unica TaxID=2547392 RepID=A0A4R5LUY9_9GAMM|nr:S1C family serine protease [Seongchinamella unica]TDG15244.1 serine protease [Seongchinamella unica]
MRLRSLLVFIPALLSACSSTDTREPTARQIREGACPASITSLDPGSTEARSRYGRDISGAELAAAQAREIRNCESLVAVGNVAALGTLASYYNGTGQQAALVSTLEKYADAGSNPAKLRDAGSYLYSAYATDQSGVPRNADKAFKYLGLAVNNGNAALQLTYARELHRRGLHSDALRYYRSIAGAEGRSREDHCQATLSLSQLYFGGSPDHENWNLGYYYWQEGLALAKTPQWGSCSEDNFTSPTYSEESRRKQFVDQRLVLMSPAQKQVVDEARRDPAKGRDFVAALNFQKPRGAPVATSAPTGRPAVYLPGWPAWAPVSAQICSQLKYSGVDRPWSEVFEANAQAIWTVDSRNGKNQSQGSAVAVSPTELITNCHLIENPRQIAVRRVGWNLPARLKASDRQGDRCILEVGNSLPAYVRRGRSHAAVKIGEDVAAIGNPKGLETSLSRGIVGQKRTRSGLRLIQTDAAISSGSSGGGLFDRAGYLVGVTTFTIAEGQSLNFAIAIDEFCQ